MLPIEVLSAKLEDQLTSAGPFALSSTCGTLASLLADAFTDLLTPACG